jgi:hypothetical protein
LIEALEYIAGHASMARHHANQRGWIASLENVEKAARDAIADPARQPPSCARKPASTTKPASLCAIWIELLRAGSAARPFSRLNPAPQWPDFSIKPVTRLFDSATGQWQNGYPRRADTPSH